MAVFVNRDGGFTVVGGPSENRQLPSSPALEAARDLLHLMIVRVATSNPEVDRASFESARGIVLTDATASPLAPEVVRRCRTPDEVWSYVKGPSTPELRSYESRRTFLRDQFDRMLTALEGFESSPIDALVAGETAKLDSAAVSAAWAKALQRRSSDPEGAITAARTLLESTCKTILDDRGRGYREGDDLPALYKIVQDALNLSPSAHTETQFRAILGACTTVVKELGSVRNRISDSHGPGRVVYRPTARHAALAVNLAGSMAVFLMETHEAKDYRPATS